MNKAQELLQLLSEQGVVFEDFNNSLSITRKFLNQLGLEKHADLFLANNPDKGIVIVGAGSTGSAIREAVELAKLDFSEVLVVSRTPKLDKLSIHSSVRVDRDLKDLHKELPQKN